MADPFETLPAGSQEHYRNMQDDLYDGLNRPSGRGHESRQLAWGSHPQHP